LISVVLLANAHAFAGPLGLPAVTTTTNLRSAAIALLGRRLFFDKRLSVDGTISCASCHIPERAFSDGLPVARGVAGQLGTRNTPSLWNVTFATSSFWDGRRLTLEQQAIVPLLNPREHGLRDDGALPGLLRQDEYYRGAFRQAFAVELEQVTLDHVAQALATFERTLVAGNSAFDRYLYGHDPTALSDAAVRGLDLFRGRAQCVICHIIGEQSALLTDNLYHSVGVGLRAVQPHLAQVATRVVHERQEVLERLISEDPEIAALGRFVITKRPRDIGSFKTPSLRNVELTAPYMHDGSARTLLEAIELELYYRGIETNRPLILTPAEKVDLLEFLKSMTSPRLDQWSSKLSDASRAKRSRIPFCNGTQHVKYRQ
jgi:cytochrome c peroxidase